MDQKARVILESYSQLFPIEVCILSREKDGSTKGNKWQKWEQVREKPKQARRINNRLIAPDEVILDYEQEEVPDEKVLKEKLKDLEDDGYGYEAYFSGSKGFHVHLKDFVGMADMSRLRREQIREHFILKFGGDMMKKSDRSMIQLEYVDHWKNTGAKKTLLKKKKGKNTLDEIKKNIKEVTDEMIDDRFLQPSLLKDIWTELQVHHKGDRRQLMMAFFTFITGRLPYHRDHMSAVAKGDSSTGKDNCFNTALKHIPTEWYEELTRTTRSDIEDNIDNIHILKLSEMNIKEEGGANRENLETLKQAAEGGLKVNKKDPATGYKTTKRVRVEQKTCVYGTIETENDPELETRFLVIPFEGGNVEKNKFVCDDTCLKVADPDFYIKEKEETESWISKGLRYLDPDLHVLIPFAPLFQKKIMDHADQKEKFFLDYTKDRIKRDQKRLFAYTKAVAWLHQRQRVIMEKEGYKFILAEPTDLITVITLAADFFNISYLDVDPRCKQLLDVMKDEQGNHDKEIRGMGFMPDSEHDGYDGWVLRSRIQKKIRVGSVNTMKERIKLLRDLELIETHYDPKVRQNAYLMRPVSTPVSNLSLPISLTGLGRLFDTFLQAENIYKQHGKTMFENNKLSFIDDKDEDIENYELVSSHEIDGSILTRQKIPPIQTHTKTQKDDRLVDKLNKHSAVKSNILYILDGYREKQCKESELFKQVMDELKAEGFEVSGKEYSEIIDRSLESGELMRFPKDVIGLTP